MHRKSQRNLNNFSALLHSCTNWTCNLVLLPKERGACGGDHSESLSKLYQWLDSNFVPMNSKDFKILKIRRLPEDIHLLKRPRKSLQVDFGGSFLRNLVRV